MDLNGAKEYFIKAANENLDGEELDLMIHSAQKIVYELAIDCIESKLGENYNVNNLSVIAQKISDLKSDFIKLNAKKSGEYKKRWDKDENSELLILENKLKKGMEISEYNKEKEGIKRYFSSREANKPDFSRQMNELEIVLSREKSSFNEKSGEEKIEAYIKYIDLIAESMEKYKFLIDVAFRFSETLAQRLFNKMSEYYDKIKILK